MDKQQLEKALYELPIDTLLTEIPEIQNTIHHLLQSNKEMREYDPEGNDTDLQQAITENKDLIKRKEQQVDVTLTVIRERIGLPAWREVGSNVVAFRKKYKEELADNKEGVFL
ncbi:hypothetical protein BDB01DRAFT_847522 [Pilobolus umbonatus]|nr:hypothetical protein BDB01DRAFT_847522 [Pilobolus umbonatus]